MFELFILALGVALGYAACKRRSERDSEMNNKPDEVCNGD